MVAARQRSFCGCKSSAPVKDVTDDAVSSSTMVRQYRQILASAEMALLQYGQIFVSNVVALRIGPMNGMQMPPLARSKPPQEKGLYDYSGQREDNRQEYKFISSKSHDEDSQAGKKQHIECK